MNNKEKYLRDGRAPIPKSDVTSRVMSANRGKDTKPEIDLRKALWEAECKGYRKNWKKVSGRPDVAFVGKKVAIFVNGCYWHRCPKCKLSLPKSNRDFWREKFARNKKRDNRKLKELEKLGWKTLIVWECEIKNNLNHIIVKIKKLLKD